MMAVMAIADTAIFDLERQTGRTVLTAGTQMRIATWNVNSLKARLEKPSRWWLERAAPDILLLQETKLSDADAPVMAFAMAGYDLVHHGEGRWNGVAIAVRSGTAVTDVVTNFGDGPVRDTSAGAATVGDEEDDFDPFDEARMVAATVSVAGEDPLRVASIYAPNGRVVDSPFYLGKLAWFDRLERWLAAQIAGRMCCSRWAGTSTSRPPTRTSGMPARSTAGRTCRSGNAQPSARS